MNGPPCQTCGKPMWGGEPPASWAHLCPPPPLDVCQHGSLRRKCEICERDEEITTLRARVSVLEKVLEDIRDNMSHFGTSPHIHGNAEDLPYQREPNYCGPCLARAALEKIGEKPCCDPEKGEWTCPA